jgi:hypothetical protein
MKVKATTTLTAAQACRIHDRLAQLTHSAWEECDYCIPALTILNDGSFISHGESCKGNFCMIKFNAENSVLYLEIDSRRHALWDRENSAGEVFALLRMEAQPHPSGEGWWYPIDLDIVEGLRIQEYNSWRKDVKFWECGMTTSAELDRLKIILEDYFRQWKPKLWRDHFLAYDPSRRVLVFYTSEEGVEYGKPAVDFLSGVDYRRLAAEGVRL